MKKLIAMISITAMLFSTIEVENYEIAKAADVAKQNLNTISDGAIKQETESEEGVGEGEKDTSDQDEDSWWDEGGVDTSIQVGDFIIDKESYFINISDESKEVWYIEKYLGNSSKVIIPDELEGQKIEGIAQSAFKNDTNLEEVQLPKSLKVIESDAFKGCIKLKNLELPETVELIDENAFEGCKSLKMIQLPKALCSIEPSSFFDTSIKEFTIDNGNSDFVTVNGVLYNKKCTELVLAPQKKSKLTLPKTVTKINSYAVWGNKVLTDVVLNTALTTIDEGAFGECSALKKVKFPNALKKIGEAAFKDCKKIKDVRISASVTSIGPSAFDGCSNIKTFKVDNKNKKYSENRGNLYNKNKTIFCAAITNKKVVTLLKSVKEVEGGAFNVCGEKINTIKVAKGNKYFSVYDNALYDKKKTELYFCPKNKKSLMLPATFKKGNYLDLSLDEVKLEKIQVKATNKLYSSYKGILYNKGMTKLIYVPAKIKKVVIPNTFTSNISELLGKGVTSIKVDAGNRLFQAKDDILYDIELKKVLFCTKNKKEIVLPKTVKTIGYESFSNCDKLKKITFSENLNKIEEFAFENCKSLEYVKFPEKGIDIGTLAFMNCSRLKWIYVPKGTNFDEAGAEYIFGGCNKFTDIYFSGTEEEWNKSWKYNEHGEAEEEFWVDYGDTMGYECDFDETVFKQLSIHYGAKAPL